MSDAWKDMQEFKSRQTSLRERLQRRKKERQEIVQAISTEPVVSAGEDSSGALSTAINQPVGSPQPGHQTTAAQGPSTDSPAPPDVDEVERRLLRCLLDVALDLPADTRRLQNIVSRSLGRDIDHSALEDLLHKLAAQELIALGEDVTAEGTPFLQVTSTEHTRLQAFVDAQGDGDETREKRGQKRSAPDPIESLLSLPSAREKETKQVGEEILELLSKPTAKERSLVERFRSQGGAQVQEFCPHGTKQECSRSSSTGTACSKLHFNKIIQKHTDESLGDCSFLNTCFHMDSCKYVHYEVDSSSVPVSRPPAPAPSGDSSPPALLRGTGPTVLHPPQWIQCDLRYFDMSILGKFSVVMADPPWDIHMELPYGTMSDDEMRQLNVPSLTDDGLIFLWVTGRAMELGRECLKLWGYERCDELIWVKTNQLQRIIRTGRTGHWLNHGKEHCLVGVKGNPKDINRGLDCDVIVAEVRATSHKPDEIYGIIERLSPGTRKIELFGRPHNVQPNWITLGNQVEGVRLTDPVLINEFRKLYPDGDCMKKPPEPVSMGVDMWPPDPHMSRPMMNAMVGYSDPMGMPEPGLMYEGIPPVPYHHYPPPPIVTPIPRQ